MFFLQIRFPTYSQMEAKHPKDHTDHQEKLDLPVVADLLEIKEKLERTACPVCLEKWELNR